MCMRKNKNPSSSNSLHLRALEQGEASVGNTSPSVGTHGSSSDDDSILWTEEFDEELDFISVMMDEDDIALGA